MTEEEIKEVVKLTVDELFNRDMIAEESDLNYQIMGNKLRQHYMKAHDRKIELALDKLKDDPYFDILPLYYGRERTLVYIAVEIGCDRVTVARNKKRLVLELYKLCFGL